MKSILRAVYSSSLTVLIFGIGMLFSFSGQAQNLTGLVKDVATQQPLVGATVSVPKWKTGGFTDENGKFSIKLGPAASGDSIDVVISYAGYNKTIVWYVGGSGESDFTISLVSENYTTEDVVITASRSIGQKRSEVTVSVDLIKPEDMDLQSSTNIENVIIQVPGVDNINGQINIRGSSGYAFGIGSRVMVMMDGLPLLSGDSGSPELSLIPMDNVSQVEIIKGPSSVLYGSSAIGGVINVIMAQPTDTARTSVRLRGGLFGDPKNKDLAWNEGTTKYGSAHLFHSQKFGDFDFTLQADLIKDQGYREFTDKEEFRGVALMGFRPKKIPGLSFGANFTYRIDSSANHLYWAGYGLDTLQNVDGNDSIVGGGLRPGSEANVLRRQLNTRVALDPYVKYLTPKGNLYWYRGRYLKNSNSNNTGQGSNNYIFYNDFLFQTRLMDRVNWTNGATLTMSRSDSDIYPGGPFDGLNYAFYSQVNGKFGKLNADFGVRYDVFTFNAKSDSIDAIIEDDIKRQGRPVFSAGVNYEVWKGANVRASFGQAFRVPSVAERFTSTGGGGLIVKPNPNIKSEIGYGAEVGIRQGFEFRGLNSVIRGAADIAVFTRRFNNMVEFGLNELDSATFFSLNPPPAFLPVFSSSNVADARINGAEFTLNLDAAWKDWFGSINGGVTLLDPLNLNGVSKEDQPDLSTFEEDFNEALATATLAEIFPLLNNTFATVNTLNDNPEILKYRSKFTGRVSGSVGYKRFSFTTNYRYRSFMESIDQYLYLVVNDLNEFRTVVNPRGNSVVDFILGYDTGKTGKFSLHINNAFNYEYDLFPGTLGEQRKYTLQYVVRF